MSSPITSLFAPSGSKSLGRKDSSLEDVITQLGNFQGFSGISTEGRNETPTCVFPSNYSLSILHIWKKPTTKLTKSYSTVPTTLTFTPSHGSTCLSLYPRTRTFTYVSSLSPTVCHATCDQHNLWRITVLEPELSELGGQQEKPRYTLERLGSDGEGSEPLEIFRRCSVNPGDNVSGRRMSRASKGSVDYGRRLSLGHFSSGLSGMMLPLSPVS